MAKMFFKQGDEEHEHAVKFMKYVSETGGGVAIPGDRRPQERIQVVEEAIKLFLDWEWEVTRRINGLMDIAVEKKDYLAAFPALVCG